MTSKTLIFLLGLTVLVVAVSAWEDETEEITVEDLQEYFMPSQIERSGPKIGPCTMKNGKPCEVCNLKIKDKKDMRRYISCAVKTAQSTARCMKGRLYLKQGLQDMPEKRGGGCVWPYNYDGDNENKHVAVGNTMSDGPFVDCVCDATEGFINCGFDYNWLS